MFLYVCVCVSMGPCCLIQINEMKKYPVSQGMEYGVRLGPSRTPYSIPCTPGMIYSVFVYLIVTVLRYELPWRGGVWSPTAVDIVTSTEVMCLCALIYLFVLAGLRKNYLACFHKIS